MTDKPTSIRTDIGQRLIDGRKIARARYVDSDVLTLGNLRAGNTGIMSAEGEVAGMCHRLAHLRQLGISHDPPSSSTVIMFQVGTANEDIVYNDLKQTLAADEVILRETECPTSWTTPNGTLVTGRPDTIICKKILIGDEKNGATEQLLPVLGLELKSIASVWTTRSVLIDGEPKLSHMAQAGHYAWQKNVPFRLIYKQYGLQELGEFAVRFFMTPGAHGAGVIDYDERSGKPWRVKPFELVYELTFSKEGYLRFRIEGSKKWMHTIVSKKDIERFFVFVSEMGPEKKLGPQPVNVSFSGEKNKKSFCKDCTLKLTCQSVKKLTGEEQYDTWLERVKEQLEIK